MIILACRQLTPVLVLALLTLLFTQCQAPEVRSSAAKTFYDLKGFMNQEKERLVKNKVSFEKKITLNGKSETKIITEPDFKVEFSEFYASDINRAAWLDKYEEQKDAAGIHYETKDDQLEVRSMDIEIENGLTTIRIEKRNKNLLNDSQKVLHYQSNEGYRMNSIRKSLGESADTLEISVKFL